MNLNCAHCGTSFRRTRPNRIFCSKRCRVSRDAIVNGRNVRKEISSGTTGAMSELLASAELLKLGWSVFRSLSPACFCDLLAIKNKKLLKLEVRTGYRSLKSGKVNYFAGKSKGAKEHEDITFCIVAYNEKGESEITFIPSLS